VALGGAIEAAVLVELRCAGRLTAFVDQAHDRGPRLADAELRGARPFVRTRLRGRGKDEGCERERGCEECCPLHAFLHRQRAEDLERAS
jgi:hypothetical protein